MVINPTLANILSDLLVNLAAGWIGTIFITPVASGKPVREKLLALTWHMFLAIVLLFMAYEITKN